MAVAERALPRGRSSLPRADVDAAQRARMVRAVIAAVTTRGYAEATVADVVGRAHVSRTSFYAQFADKEACFLAAMVHGQRSMLAAMSGAVEALPETADDEVRLRAGIRAHLRFLAGEPMFATAFYLQLPAAGRRGVDQVADAHRKLAARTAAWHTRARGRHADWPGVPAEVYRALAAGTSELVREHVRNDATADLPALENVVVDLHLRLLAPNLSG